MNAAKLRLLADYIEARRGTFNMGDSSHCIVGYGLKMDGNIGFYEKDADGDHGVRAFAKRYDMELREANNIYSGVFHREGRHNEGAAASATILRKLADIADPPKTVIPIEVRSEPVAITVAIRQAVKERELVPA